MIKRIRFFVLFTLVLPILVNSSCTSQSKTGFGIYLADTGELVLSGEHIQAYFQETHTIELNAAGMAKWNSYIINPAKLGESLFNRPFVINVNGEEIYRGLFYSMLSSLSYSGFVIMDAQYKMPDITNSIRIKYDGATASCCAGVDLINDPRILDYFEGMGKLK
ncbi:MAG: hypothetical protein PHE50_06395 [Dehalococcoidales bacterium]|nr:hypothetical protein [Dehalococcoidales bacterium]